MNQYRYRGTDLSGTTTAGELRAASADDAHIRLLNKGIVVSEISPTIGRTELFLLRRLGGTEISRFTRQLAILLRANLGLLEALGAARAQVRNHRLGRIVDSMVGEIEAGRSLSEALGEYVGLFGELYVGIVRAGESSGDLAGALERVADHRERYEAILKKVTSALTYPLIVVAVAIIVMAVLLLYVVPVFTTMYETFDAELPPLTASVIRFSTVLREHLLLEFGILIGLVALLLFLASRPAILMWSHRLVLGVPMVGKLVRGVITARFARTLGTLLSGGVEIIQAIRIASRAVGNRHVRAQLSTVETAIASGQSLTTALEGTQSFPPTFLKLVSSGERTAQLGPMLLRAADYYDTETNNAISTMMALIEPLTLVILGAVVAFLLLAMYLPLFELVNTLG